MGMFNPLDNVHKFDPDKHIPTLRGKVIVVTGGNSGCGKETVLQLAKHTPGRIYLAARSKAKYDDAMAAITATVANARDFVKFLELDLASLASVKKASETVLSENDRLDLLINNAGIMAVPHGLTQDGFEVQFGTNHLGHALLTRQLLPLMEKTSKEPSADVRIINLSSVGHTMAVDEGIRFDELKTPMKALYPLRLYASSKLANVLYTRELARRYPDILSVSIHPGRVETNLGSTLSEEGGLLYRFTQVMDFLVKPLPVDAGALNQIWAATWKRSDVVNGAYYVPAGKENQGSKLSRDANLRDKLWTWTEEQLKDLGY
jgi:NAD(P)-dependent dehydrogenase (short-subunit alcohol dehydrogenase family)